ncbi:MAG: (d)CMP kinase [Candidatus Izimaplasma sp.]|nr:(d)CMP kinase [Candidatus Izimaplasma bacterium]
MKTTQIAIDGPAGAGKSTIAKMVAKELSFQYLDTGAMYRAVTYFAIEENINLKDPNSFRFVKDLTFDFKHNHIFLNGKDITNKVRTHQVSNNVSDVAAIKLVRQYLVEKQREIAEAKDIVMDGRDIGTKVLKNADYKFFLTASIEQRAKRRYNENLEKGIDTDFDKLVQEIKRRDDIDSNRKINPLRPADDAVIIDTSSLNQNQVLQLITDKIRGVE